MPVSGEASDEQIVQQIRAMVEAELQRRGWPDKPRCEGQQIVLGKGATQARADLSGSIKQWDSLPDDLRQRRAQQIAQLLCEATQRGPVVSRRPRESRAKGWNPLSFFGRVISFVLALAVIVVTYRYVRAPNRANSPLAAVDLLLDRAGAVASSVASAVASTRAPSYDASNAEHERAVIASAACGKSRTRVARGGSVGPTDVEGWQVELVLLRRGPPVNLSQISALSQFVQRRAGSTTGALVWAKASSLVAEQSSNAQVEVRALPPLGKRNVSGVSFVFSGPYVVPYFTEDLRVDYFRLADAMADALGATDGALFAHCADSEAHHVGAWFLGTTPGSALASLIYFMESYSDMPVLKPEVFGSSTDPARRGHAFDSIEQAAGALGRSSVATLVGSELGMISGQPNKPARLTFPFRDGNRASRAGLQAARSLGLSSER
ncbi:MAG TPA: hypothetical protein VFK05_37115 [Polyangiaceae bacterium]|nr:hypothetical protein [Polyangiaceae bacterium]